MADVLHIDGLKYQSSLEAEEAFGIGEKQLLVLSEKGLIKTIRAGGRLYIGVDSLREFLAHLARLDEASQRSADSDSSAETAHIVPPTHNLPVSAREVLLARALPSELAPPVAKALPAKSAVPLLLATSAALALLVTFAAVPSAPRSLVASAGSIFGSLAKTPAVFSDPLSYTRGETQVGAVSSVEYGRLAQATPASELPSAGAPAPKETASPAPTIVQNYITQPVIERVIEVPPSGGNVSEGALSAALQQLENKFTAMVYGISAQSSSNAAHITNVYNEVAQSQRIDQLSNIRLTNPTISGGTISGISIGGSSITGDINIGSATVTALAVTGSATSTFANGLSLTGGCVLVNGTCLGSSGTGTVGSGTQGQFAFYNTAGTTLTATSSLFAAQNQSIGVGTTSPFRKFAVVDSANSAPQIVLTGSGGEAQFFVNSTGDLNIGAAGADTYFNNDNLWVCTGGSITTGGCPSGSPSGQGNLVVENKIGIATSTPAYALDVFGDFRIDSSGRLIAPYSSAPTLDTNGQIAIDSTSNQVKFRSASATLVLGNGNLYPSFTYSTSTAWTGTTTIPLGTAYIAETWNGVQCYTDAGTLNVSFYDGTNRMNMFNASTTIGTVTLSTNNTFTAAETRKVDIGTPASSPTKISCTISKSITAD